MEQSEFLRQLEVNGRGYDYYDIRLLEERGIAEIARLPFSIRVLVENLLRKLDGRIVREEDLKQVARWRKDYEEPVEIPYHPARVLMQDFTRHSGGGGSGGHAGRGPDHGRPSGKGESPGPGGTGDRPLGADRSFRIRGRGRAQCDS